jgi:hypothetical protein
VIGSRSWAELGHVSENGDLAMLACSLGEMLQRGRHGQRVGVVAVVDEDALSGERDLLPAPTRELHLPRAALRLPERQTERVVRGEGGERVRGIVAPAEAHFELEAHSVRLDLEF